MSKIIETAESEEGTEVTGPVDEHLSNCKTGAKSASASAP